MWVVYSIIIPWSEPAGIIQKIVDVKEKTVMFVKEKMTSAISKMSRPPLKQLCS